ncbi:hypothetical protein FB451DRAFT_1559523, partial [Mycena latifolia]
PVFSRPCTSLRLLELRSGWLLWASISQTLGGLSVWVRPSPRLLSDPGFPAADRCAAKPVGRDGRSPRTPTHTLSACLYRFRAKHGSGAKHQFHTLFLTRIISESAAPTYLARQKPCNDLRSFRDSNLSQ